MISRTMHMAGEERYYRVQPLRSRLDAHGWGRTLLRAFSPSEVDTRAGQLAVAEIEARQVLSQNGAPSSLKAVACLVVTHSSGHR